MACATMFSESAWLFRGHSTRSDEKLGAAKKNCPRDTFRLFPARLPLDGDMVNGIMDEVIGPPGAANWARIGALLEALLALPAGERSAWLDEACGTDASLRAELESLAAASAGSASFLDQPALEYLTPGRPAPDSETDTMSIDEVTGLAA